MKNIYLFCTLLLLALSHACGSDEGPGAEVGPDQPQQPEQPAVTPEAVVVPTGFDWSTEAVVHATLESAVETVVSIYSDKACKEDSRLVENALLEAGQPRTFRMAVPVGAGQLFVKYPAASGSEGVVSLSMEGSDAVSYKFPTDAVRSTYQKVDNYQYYYNSGVIMVEDMWPDFAASDADFNDLVMEYDLKTTECTTPAMLPAHGYKEGLTVTLDIRGVGSGRTKKAGLQLDFDNTLVKEVETKIYEKAGQGKIEEIKDGRFSVDVDLTQPGKVLILFDGLDKLVDGKHYQTTQGEIVVGKPMIRAYIHLRGVRDRSKLTGEQSRAQAEAFRDVVSDAYRHDFFMVLKPQYNGSEIHQKGFAPTYRYKNYEADSKGLMSAVPYCSNDNEVWVLRLPVGTPHVYDRVSIFTAYPKLKGWIESNGQENRTWYTEYDHDLVPRYW